MKTQPLIPSLSGILYPADEIELKEILGFAENMGEIEKVDHLPLVAWIPSASYEYILSILQKTMRVVSVLKPKRIVIISGLHRPPIESDTRDSLFFPATDTIVSNAGIIPIDRDAIEMLRDSNELRTKCIDIYFKEEYAFELISPFIAYYYQHVPVIPMLIETKHASYSIAKEAIEIVCNTCRDTLYIIAANLNTDPKIQNDIEHPFGSLFSDFPFFPWQIIESRRAPVADVWYAGAIRKLS
ncbi:MAG: AmmeMemoRadiSam system protein B [Sphaerochaetaceae bacterium]|jgi:AmmeMemoRadiSam system protein B|nr:AmmeMemoRadiSam system protein B [Sphaerochaetaceae bacterium]NLO59832.1 AmmeMemoRadiSam system protein B [Spirochaetales bacterium]MDD3670738.1 AmmeMemoRadiSam system protein B [Sphaerochaetaceae bacterium]MDD4259464.1 AmmeMemoRadiSam system protein B [Sphaerochaetaceae bacterium]MDD4842370.1 AmmeMemoRadiSam system protein B [Sphaerochaetaceae bacterium]